MSNIRRIGIALAAALAAGAVGLPPAHASGDASIVGHYQMEYVFDDGLKQTQIVTLSADHHYSNEAGGQGAWNLDGERLTISYTTKVNHTIKLEAISCAVSCAGSMIETGDGQTWNGRFTATHTN